ncbi:HAD family phosphatase, partial [Rhizobium leguminosarum]
MTTDLRHIVFYIGKVLILYEPNLPFSRLIPEETEIYSFVANICPHDW